MRQIYTLEIAALVRELRNLIHYRIDKFYETGRGRFRIRAHSLTSKTDILCILGQTVNATSYVESADFPTSFAQGARRRITNSVIEEVTQLNDDRIIEFVLSKDGRRFSIILEMFAKCNLVITEGDGTIDMAYFRHRFRDRIVRKGEVYKAPENSAVRMSNLDGTEGMIRAGFESAERQKSVIKVLAGITNLGSMYVEDVLNRLDINPREPISGIDEQAIKSISKGIASLGSIAERPKPRIYMSDGKTIDYSLSDIKKYSDLESIEFVSVQELLDHFYHTAQEGPQTRENPAAKELEISIEKQKEVLGSMVEGIGANKSIGEAIFKNMHMVNQLIEAAQADRHITREKVIKMFPGITIYNVDLENKTVEIEL